MAQALTGSLGAFSNPSVHLCTEDPTEGEQSGSPGEASGKRFSVGREDGPLGLPTPWQLQRLASKCGLPESKIRVSSNLAKFCPFPVHPEGPGQASSAGAASWSPVDPSLSGNERHRSPLGSEWDLRHHMAGFT